MSNTEARAQAYRDYAAQIRRVAARCEFPDAKAELENLARQLESLVPASPIFSAEKRAWLSPRFDLRKIYAHDRR